MMPTEYIPAGENAPRIETGEQAAAFWRDRIMTTPQFRPEVEWTVTLLLEGNRQLLGHLAPESDGAWAWVSAPVRRVLRAILLTNAAGIVEIHNHPAGELEPSDSDMRAAQSLLSWLELLGVSLFDFVIVDRIGQGWYSFANAGQFVAREAVIKEVRGKTYEDALNSVMECVDRADPRLQPLVSESANLAGVSMPQWLGDFLLRQLQEYFNPAPAEDRRLALAAAFLGRRMESTKVLFDEARRAGKGVTEFVWDEALAALEKRFAPQLEAVRAGV